MIPQKGKEKNMKKIYSVVFALLLAGFLYSVVSGRSENCTTKVVEGKNFTVCYTMTSPNLDKTRVGGYSFLEVIAFSREVNLNGDEVIYQIAPDMGTVGSMNSQTGEVTGFYTVTRAGGDVVYFPEDRCTTSYHEDGKTFTSCYYDGVPNLPADHTGGYAFAQAIGAHFQSNDTGGFDMNQITPNTGLTGSLYTTGPFVGQVAGFYQVIRPEGDFVLYPIGK